MVITGKVVAVDKDKAVVDVTIVWVIGLLVDVVVVITNAELDISKVVCSVLGLAVLNRNVEIVELGTVECLVLVLGIMEVEVV